MGEAEWRHRRRVIVLYECIIEAKIPCWIGRRSGGCRKGGIGRGRGWVGKGNLTMGTTRAGKTDRRLHQQEE